MRPHGDNLSIGVDVASVAASAASLAAFGDRYTSRLFTPRELAPLGHGAALAASLAGRFAAKEATLKVLGPTDEPIAWRAIEILRLPGGAVGVELSGAAQRRAEVVGLGPVAVSLTHEGDLAVAVAIASVRRRRRFGRRPDR